MKYINIIFVLALFFNLNANAQDFKYTLIYENPLQLNPALMGMNNDLKVSLSHRNQWGPVGDAYYTTSSFTAMAPIFIQDSKGKIDIGTNVIMDNSGAYETFSFSLAAGYGLKISKYSNLSLIINGGYVMKSLDVSSLTFDQQYVLGSFDAGNSNGELILNEKLSYPEVGFGILWYTDNYIQADNNLNAFIGVSGYHLNNPNESYTGYTGILPPKYVFHGGVEVLLNNEIGFTPNLILATQSGKEYASAGLYVDYHFDYSKLTFGTWYRLNDGLAFLFKYQHENFVIGYGYDFSTTVLGGLIDGIKTHEISLSFRLNMKDGADNNDDDEEDY
ncbi:MAG: PorP/SprF family type IX secretion system membrane protein [Bacteroidales bacterium]|nr:PorP/SprF family type IX secretion system membrane protein [Bacteroidales bacterium]